MDTNQLYNQFITDFHLEALPEEERDGVLLEISKTIQKQFLLDVHDAIGEEKFDALHASANMGEEFYATTLKHLVPNHEQLFASAREKVKKAFNAEE